MIKWYFNIITLLFCIWPYIGYSQTGCTVPLPPVLKTVSVQPETGYTELHWELSPSSGIAAYIAYSYKEPDGLPLDTIWDPAATNYLLINTASKYSSVSYVVTAYRPSVIPGENGCTSPLSNVLTTIFCSPVIDTCNNKISVKWNRYSDFPKQVKEYKILVSVNGGILAEVYTTDKNTDNFIITDFITDSQYCFAVKAMFNDGTWSTSNKSCLSTKMQRPPDWINADYATISSEDEISLSFTVDPLSEIKRFSLERKTGNGEIFREISRPVSVNGSVLVTDSEADIYKINYYRLSAVNSCNLPVRVSNPASNIVLNLDRSGDDLLLSWNPNKNWLGGVLEYTLFINPGNGYTEQESVSAADSVIRLGYKEIMYDISGEEVCFYIEAREASNPHGINGKARSAEKCSTPNEIITVPNMFTPDNDMVNDKFRPILSFTPSDYYLIISDRKGNVLYESRNFLEEWDGSVKGKSDFQDICLWFLKVTTPAGKTISKTGTLTVVRNR